MKTLVHCLLAGLAATTAAVAGYWIAAAISIQPAVPSAPRVPLAFRLPENPPEVVRLDAEAREAVARSVSRYASQVERAEIFLGGGTPSSYGREDAGPVVRFSLKLLLKDGTRLSTKPRQAKPKVLTARIDECVRHCMKRYKALKQAGRNAATISNI